jgi:hypothetical protein
MDGGQALSGRVLSDVCVCGWGRAAGKARLHKLAGLADAALGVMREMVLPSIGHFIPTHDDDNDDNNNRSAHYHIR